MWADQPAQMLPALVHQAVGHLPGGFEWGDQSVTINLPGPLHSGSSVTTNKYPHVKIAIPSHTPEEQDHDTPLLSGMHNTLAVTMPKTPWKPRVTLMAEVGDLLDWGMTDNYDCESEQSTMAKEPGTKADTSLPTKMEVLVPPLDTSSQASDAETEASMESNPISTSPIAAAHSSCSDSPIADLPKLQADVHLAINYMLSAKRSSDLEIQWAIQDFEASLHQREEEAATANKKAKVTQSRRDLEARVKGTKAVMKAKHD